MKKFNHGGRLASAFLLMSLLIYVMSSIVGGAAEPINANQEGQDPYDWSNYPGEVILDAPEFILGDDTDGAAEPGEITGGNADEQQGSGDHIPLFTDTETPGETGNNPDTQNTDTPGEQGADQPTEPGTEITDPPNDPQPADLQSLFEVEIKLPSGWFNVPEKAVRVKITPKTDVLWEKVKYRVDDGDWQETRKADFTLKDGYYYCDVTVTANCILTVRLSDGEAYFDTAREIRIFDHLAPVVTAGFREKILHVEAPDDLSGAAGVQVNGLLFTTLENGMLDVQMEEVLLTYKQLAIRAYDYAGNFSDPVTLDNPYYLEPTPTPKATKKPAATQKPVVTEAPTPTPKPTKKPSGGGSGASEKDTETEKPTKAPAATAAPEKQEPIVIIVTPPPTAEPAPTPTPEIEYVPLGPGQPFTQHGNMATRDVLYSASTNKQFISVQSRNGQTYYMVIDYDKPIDEANEIYETYFLNMVDDRDLMSVLTDEEIVPTPTPQIIYVTPEPTTVPQPTQPPAEPQKKSDNSAMALLLLIIVLLAVVGFAVWFIMNQRKTTVPNLPEYDEDEYEMDESEEETDSGDHEE
ncbi:MAG: DUF4366 domain-containing protein [Clostridia bacterium]|nr:DUF4366 domain-containing protein [Clostridia bacterium]